MKEFLKQIIAENHLSYIQKIKKNDNLVNYINEEFNKILLRTENKIGLKIDCSKLNLPTKIYLIINNYETIPECPVCHKVKNEQNVLCISRGYSRCCSRKCSDKDPLKIKNTEQTFIKKYGVKSFFLSDAGKKAKKEWCEKNGVSNPFQLDWVNEKAKDTRKRLYGVEYTMQSKDKRQLASENYMRNHGYDSQFHDPEVIKKIKDKRDENIKNGVDEKTVFRRNARRRRYLLLASNDHVEPRFTIDDFEKLTVKTQYTTMLKWHCKDCGKDFESLLDQNFVSREHIPARCMNCHPLINQGFSREEKRFVDFLKIECCQEVIENNSDLIKPFEIDAVIENKNLCFEFDGLFWHSEKRLNKGKFYHLSKTEKVEKLGYQLIHIFEDEWVYKMDIVKSRIKNLLGIYERIIYARKCEIRIVDKKDSVIFQDNNHLQGSIGSKISLGLYLENELVSLMTFGKPRFNKKYEWELLRFCNKLNYHVIGGASKLLSHFERNYNPKSLISYADRRWSKGNLYEKLGFKFINYSDPSYFYTKAQKRYSRIMFQKHKLRDKLYNFDSSKTEKENMKNNGYDIIWDCGNMVFVKEYLVND